MVSNRTGSLFSADGRQIERAAGDGGGAGWRRPPPAVCPACHHWLIRGRVSAAAGCRSPCYPGGGMLVLAHGLGAVAVVVHVMPPTLVRCSRSVPACWVARPPITTALVGVMRFTIPDAD